MSAILFVGGPWHGEVHDIPDDRMHWLIPVVSAAGTNVKAWDGWPEDLTGRPYVRQKFGDPRTKRMREAMVWGDLGYSHPRVDYEFRQALVTAWVNGRIG